nr:MAG TPA: hypothetical protein [Caudoviricetes sp.]
MTGRAKGYKVNRLNLATVYFCNVAKMFHFWEL